jgi:hypothetical protein
VRIAFVLWIKSEEINGVKFGQLAKQMKAADFPARV